MWPQAKTTDLINLCWRLDPDQSFGLALLWDCLKSTSVASWLSFQLLLCSFQGAEVSWNRVVLGLVTGTQKYFVELNDVPFCQFLMWGETEVGIPWIHKSGSVSMAGKKYYPHIAVFYWLNLDVIYEIEVIFERLFTTWVSCTVVLCTVYPITFGKIWALKCIKMAISRFAGLPQMLVGSATTFL